MAENGEAIRPADIQGAYRGLTSYLEARRLGALWKKHAAGIEIEQTGELAVSLTGSGTLSHFQDVLELGFATQGRQASVTVGGFDSYVSDLMDPESPIRAQNPDCLLFVVDSLELWKLADQAEHPDQLPALVDESVAFLLSLLAPLAAAGCAVFLTNAVPKGADSPGTTRRSFAGSNWRVAQRWNETLEREADAGIHVLDVCFEAMKIGLNSAIDYRQWCESRLPYHLDFVPRVASRFVMEACRLASADKKVIVLDCDNTLWGGVVGDDGLEGIEVGLTPGRPKGYAELQRFLRDLRRTGFLLAVCSKNDEANVLEVFRSHEEMVLREEDIVSFKVNWEPKADNIAQIAEELNLGLDSFVFLDDNPAEIEIVEQFLPAVETILASPDPIETLTGLANNPVLFKSSVSQEDLEKTRQYKVEDQRRSLAKSVSNYDEYLASLEMYARCEKINSQTVARVSQLLNKSNQFNLTTIRRTEAEVLALCSEHTARTLTIRLGDKFGEHGLVCIAIAHVENEQMTLETLVMSCRVLKRDVEKLMLNALVQIARKEGAHTLLASWVKTAKNGLVKDLLDDLGFELTASSEERKDYRLNIDGFSEFATHISLT
jgi:FkbH-like protein